MCSGWRSDPSTRLPAQSFSAIVSKRHLTVLFCNMYCSVLCADLPVAVSLFKGLRYSTGQQWADYLSSFRLPSGRNSPLRSSRYSMQSDSISGPQLKKASHTRTRQAEERRTWSALCINEQHERLKWQTGRSSTHREANGFPSHYLRGLHSNIV